MSDLIRMLKNAGVVVSRDVNLRAGEKSNFYVDVKKAYGEHEILHYLAIAMSKIINSDVTCVATKGYGGLPLATTVSQIMKIHLSMVRDEIKEHGLGKLIVGYTPNADDRVVIVDDVMTSGGSLNEVADAIEKTGASILGAYVVVKRSDINMRFPVKYLVHADDLLS